VVFVPNEPGSRFDCAFSLVREDAPPDEPLPSTPTELVCLDCALDLDPAMGRALDLARAHGSAELVDGEWKARREE
jgi:hypothetical protein